MKISLLTLLAFLSTTLLQTQNREQTIRQIYSEALTKGEHQDPIPRVYKCCIKGNADS